MTRAAPTRCPRERFRSLGDRLQREARLADAARPGERDESRVHGGYELDDFVEFSLAPEERSRRHREVRPIEALQCGEVAAAQLERSLGRAEILEAMLAEVGQLGLDERRGRRRDEHLSTVPCGGNAGSAVEVVSHVAFLADEGGPCVDADPHPDRAVGLETLSERGGCSQRPRRRRECEEEGIALRVDLDTTVTDTCLPNHRPVIGERRSVRLHADVPQQRRRAFDVREEEGDRAGRKLGPHAGIIGGSPVVSKRSDARVRAEPPLSDHRRATTTDALPWLALHELSLGRPSVR